MPPVALLGMLGIVAAFALLIFADTVDQMLVAMRRRALTQCEPPAVPPAAKVLI